MAAKQSRSEPGGSNIRGAILLRIRLVFILTTLLAVGIFFKIIYIQSIEAKSVNDAVKMVKLFRAPIPATRGNIYAGDGKSLLATSLPRYQLGLDMTVASDTLIKYELDSLCERLANFFQDEPARVYRMRLLEARQANDKYTLVNSKYISQMDMKMMSVWPFLRKGRFKAGVSWDKSEKRTHPFGILAERTLGSYLPGKKLSGLENSFNEALAGKDGVGIFRRIFGGVKRPVIEEKQPIHGYDLVTTLDVNLQDVAEAALERELKKNKADYGCVILMEVATGDIKAIANLGQGTEPNDTAYLERINYALVNRAEPGSTFKLASYLALLQEGAHRITDPVNCEGGKKRYGSDTMYDSGPGRYEVTLKDAFAYSSNVAVSKLVSSHFGNNPKMFFAYLDKFGLTKDINFQIEGHLKPLFTRPDSKKWTRNNLPWLSVGYNCLITPLQTLTFYNAVANNGKMVAPRIVKEVRRANQIIDSFPTRVLDQQIASETPLKAVREMLDAVVEYGTAKNIKHDEYKIAGKTGTTKKVIAGKYAKKYYCSFAGYFPAENPKYSCIVIIDNPEKPLYGADVAAPVFQELASKIYALDISMHKKLDTEIRARAAEARTEFPQFGKGYYKDLTTISNFLGITSTNPSGHEAIVTGQQTKRGIVWTKVPTQNYIVPDLKGMTLRDALPMLENMGYVVEHQGNGKVTSQTPSAGTPLGKRGVVHLVLEP